MKLAGILPPLVTPFREDGGVDLPAFESNLESYASSDLGGCLVLGSNGEAASLEEEEKLALVRAARRLCGSRPLLVGTGLEATRSTIAFTRRVGDLGADAALVLTPHYYKAQVSEEVLRRHFESVAEASSIPVLLYSVPAFTGIPFPPGLASVLARHPNVAGMKESSGDLGLMGRILSSVPPSFAVACCAPGPSAALYRAFLAGDHPRARQLQAALTPLAVAVTTTWGVAGLKAAMDAAGFRGGFVRAPLLPVPTTARAELAAVLAQAVSAAG